MLTRFPGFKGHEACGEIVQIDDLARDAGFGVVGSPKRLLKDTLDPTTCIGRLSRDYRCPWLWIRELRRVLTGSRSASASWKVSTGFCGNTPDFPGCTKHW